MLWNVRFSAAGGKADDKNWLVFEPRSGTKENARVFEVEVADKWREQAIVFFTRNDNFKKGDELYTRNERVSATFERLIIKQS
jgi:hypothetical protein